MAAAAGVVADCERELYYLAELKSKHHQLRIEQLDRHLNAILDDIKRSHESISVLQSAVTGLQRAVLQLQEAEKSRELSR